MKKLIFIFITLFIPFVLEAQNKLSVKQLLDKTSNRIATDSGVETGFLSKIYRNGGLESSTHGRLLLKGKKFVLETEDMKTWYDGKYQWSFIFEMEEVNVSEPTQDELNEINPYELLNLYKRGYSSTYIDSASRVVLLQTKDKKNNLQEIKLWISPQYEPNKIEVYTKDSRRIIIEVQSFRSNLNLSPTDFHFNEQNYPDIEIIDLR